MILTISSLKGGVGKTTIAAFLAQALRARGHRVLSVDLDHNNNLTDYYLREEDGATGEGIESSNIRQVLTGSAKLCGAYSEGRELKAGAIWSAPLGDIIPATPSLATVGYELAHDPGAVLRLRSGLRKLDYDYVVIDTPPALTLELTAGLYAADLVLVPVSASRWTVQGYQVISSEVAKVGDAIGQAPRILAVPSMVSETEAAALRDSGAPWICTEAWIRRDPSVKLAASEGRGLRAGTRGSESFAALAGEVAHV